MWVLDPQKYADASVHRRYVTELAGHDAVTVFVLNQADRLAPEEQAVCVADLEDLLVRWLGELLYLYETQRLLCCTFTFTLLEPAHLTATVAGETLDSNRHPIDTEIKAVTYHQIAVEQVGGHWQARVIFDL